jgi:hypothetical protein
MKIKLINTRIVFPHLFEADPKFGKYSVRPLIKKGSDNEILIRDAIEKEGKEHFGTKWDALKKSLTSSKKLVLQDGDDKAAERPEYADMYYANIKSAVRPHVVGRDGSPISKDDNIIYAGCRVDLIMDLYAYEHKEYGKFILTKLLGVQFRADDTRLTGGVVVTEDDFKPITAGADSEDL